MNLSPKSVAVLAAVAFAVAAAGFCGRAQLQSQAQAQAQNQSRTSSSSNAPVPANSNLIVLDPAHGGADNGATLDGNVLEKNLTLALAGRLRSALTSAGFNVIATRDADPSDPLSTDERAEIANHTHALACIVLHATAAGSGVHIYTSMLPPPADSDDQAPSGFVPVAWQTAQARFVTQSQSLAATLTAAFAKGNLAALSSTAPLRPLDNLMCPAIAIEIAPQGSSDTGPVPATNTAYQQQVASVLASALRTWRGQAQPTPSPGQASPVAMRGQLPPIAARRQALPTSFIDLDAQIAAQSRAMAGGGRRPPAASTSTGRGPRATAVNRTSATPARMGPQ